MLVMIVMAPLLPMTLTPETAEACRPVWWRCPLNGHHSCGRSSPPPSALRAIDTLERGPATPDLP